MGCGINVLYKDILCRNKFQNRETEDLSNYDADVLLLLSVELNYQIIVRIFKYK